ncbi:MAG: YggT family protein [Eggerthellaceae bacterium]|nr:YggT family protein [Eggerthellaceae bacterium]
MIMRLIVELVDIYTFIIFVYILLSWIPTKSGILGDIDNVLSKICDPYLDLFKKFIPPIGGMVDISPIIAIVVLQLAVRVLYFIF